MICARTPREELHGHRGNGKTKETRRTEEAAANKPFLPLSKEISERGDQEEENEEGKHGSQYR